MRVRSYKGVHKFYGKMSVCIVKMIYVIVETFIIMRTICTVIISFIFSFFCTLWAHNFLHMLPISLMPKIVKVNDVLAQSQAALIRLNGNTC